MHYPFEVADPLTNLHYRPSNSRLGEVSLAPMGVEWSPGAAIDEVPHTVWAQSLKNAWVETVAAVTAALQELCLASPTLRPIEGFEIPAGRVGIGSQHCPGRRSCVNSSEVWGAGALPLTARVR